MGTIVRELAMKLDLLRQQDIGLQVFGADGHTYRSTRVSPSDIQALEAFAGAPLPADYRDWLSDVGWGAGPDYGLMSPQAVISEDRSSMAGTGGDIESIAKIRRADVIRYIAAVQTAGTHFGMRVTADSFRGSIIISHQGCNGYSHLVVEGEMSGRVFGECGDLVGAPWTAAGAFWPASRDPLYPTADSTPLTFLEWIESWLDNGLARAARGFT